MSTNAQRKSLRTAFRQARKQLTEQQQYGAAQALSERALSLPFWPQVKRIAAYLANDGEVSLSPLIAHCQSSGIAVTLPVLHPFTQKHLLFLDYQSDTPMTQNQFGIEEPVLSTQGIRLLSEHDVLLMPLVGFDSKGNRLGMGGGFYDRTLAFLESYYKPPRLIGIAHDCQQAESLPVESWDIPLNGILTPTQFIAV